MNLTSDQRQSLQDGEPVEITVNGTQCVLLRKDHYERLQQVLEHEAPEWTVEEMRSLAARTFADADEAGPIR